MPLRLTFRPRWWSRSCNGSGPRASSCSRTSGLFEDFRLAGRELARVVTARAKGGEYSSLHQPWAARPENSINAGCRLS
jgi:hypothetical protein